ncbi:putative metal-binding motif-containing protein [Candidatus Woesearchaeota archaeon]|nr:putative metal-binding motif-containing protein [Candidatus Woesearchaeota archaeon]
MSTIGKKEGIHMDHQRVPSVPIILIIIGVSAITFLLTGCVQLENGNGEETLEETQPAEEQPAFFVGESTCPAGKDDLDGDGICSGATLDCDDSDPTINPNSQERCDGVDNDCDTKVDEGCEVECYDECVPEGQHCATGTDELKKCANADGDPCLELLRIECTYGCSAGTCRTAAGTPLEETYIFARPSTRQTVSEAIRTPTYTISAEPCSGSFIGTVEWNEDGALCRRHRFEDAGRGYLTPLSCCERHFNQVTCVRDHGEVPYQAEGLSFKYHEVGCYGQSNPAVN